MLSFTICVISVLFTKLQTYPHTWQARWLSGSRVWTRFHILRFLGMDDIGLSSILALHSFSAVQKPSFYRHTPKRYLLSEARSAVGYGHPDIPDVQAWI